MILPEQSRAARAVLSISQEELARLAGVSTNTVIGFERGITEPKAKTLLALRSALEAAGIAFIDGEWPGVRRQKTKSPEDL